MEEESCRYNWYNIEDMDMSEEQQKIVQSKEIEKIQAIQEIKSAVKVDEVSAQTGSFLRSALLVLSAFGIGGSISPDLADAVVNNTTAIVSSAVMLGTAIWEVVKTIKTLKKK